MRRRVREMNELDDLILEFYKAMGTPGGKSVAMTPMDVYENLAVLRSQTSKSKNTISRHMQILRAAGFLKVTSEDRGSYTITDLGLRYLEDDLTEMERAGIERAITWYKEMHIY